MTMCDAHYPREGNLSAELQHPDYTMVQSYRFYSWLAHNRLIRFKGKHLHNQRQI